MPDTIQTLSDLSDEDLSTLLNAVLAEQERRRALATIPGQITALAGTYVAGGGDPADLHLGL